MVENSEAFVVFRQKQILNTTAAAAAGLDLCVQTQFIVSFLLCIHRMNVRRR